MRRGGHPKSPVIISRSHTRKREMIGRWTKHALLGNSEDPRTVRLCKVYDNTQANKGYKQICVTWLNGYKYTKNTIKVENEWGSGQERPGIRRNNSILDRKNVKKGGGWVRWKNKRTVAIIACLFIDKTLFEQEQGWISLLHVNLGSHTGT